MMTSLIWGCGILGFDEFAKMLMIVNFQDAKLSELESLTGIRREMWCRWFSGHYDISGKSLVKASQALNVSPSTLLEQIEKRKALRGKKNATPKNVSLKTA